MKHITSKLLSLLLCLAMLMSMVPVAYAENETEGETTLATAEETATGSGTEADPYVVNTQEQLDSVLSGTLSTTVENPTYIKLGAGEFTTYGKTATQGKSLVFIGNPEGETTWKYGKTPHASGDGSDGNGNGDYSFDGSTVSFSHINFVDNWSEDADYRGFVRLVNAKFDSCKFNNRITYWGTNPTFTNCDFTSSAYVMWMGTDASFTGCTFTSTVGKFINAYDDGSSNNTYNLEFNNCSFISGSEGEPVNKYPAVILKGYNSNAWMLSFNNTTINTTSAQYGNIVTGSQLYGINDPLPATTVTIDGAVVWQNGAKVDASAGVIADGVTADNGTVTATVTGTPAAGDETIKVDATVSDATEIKSAAVTVSNETLAAVAGKNDVVIETNVGTLAVSKEALSTMKTNAEENVDLVLSIADVKREDGTNYTAKYELTAKAGTTDVFAQSESGGNGEVTVTVPYELKTEGATPVVYYVNGSDETVVNSTFENNTLSWTTDHFSTYAVKEEPAVATAVAKVGETSYDTLADAIANAVDSDTVTLLADTKEDVTIDKSITLDLGGKTLTNTNAGKSTLTVTESAVVTAKNGSIMGGTGRYTIEVSSATASLTLEEVTATAGNTGSSMIDNWGTLTINSGTYAGGLNVVKSEEGSTLTINGGTFTLSYATNGYTGVIFAYGTTTITGGEFIQSLTTTGSWNHPQVVATGVVEGYTATTVVTGGTFTNKMSGEGIFRGVGKGTSDNFKVSGGTYNKSVSDGFFKDGYFAKKVGSVYTAVGPYEAKIGTKGYNTLAAAVEAVANNGTITLLQDISSDRINLETKSFKVSLNGHTLTSTAAYGVMFCAKNGNKITVMGDKHSKLVGTLMVTSGTDGHIEVNGGTYENPKYCPIYINGAVNSENSKLTVKDATITASGTDSDQDTGCAVYLAGYCTSIFKNTTITAPVTGIEIRAGKLTLQNCTVTGGNGTVTTNANGNGTTVTNAALAISQHTTRKPIDVTITGGKYTATAALYQTDVQGTGSAGVNATVNSGKFNGTVSAETNNTVAVKGGTFTNAVPENCCATGFVPTKNADGTFGVKEDTSVAEVNGDKYNTLQAAIGEAPRNATVKLLADTKENVTISTNNVTLDLNGFTLNGGTEKGKPALTITARYVTIMDSSAAQTGTIMREDTAENSGDSSHYVIDIQSNAMVTFESGNVKNDSGNDEGKGESLVRIGNDTVKKYPQLTIKGGTFTQDNFVAVKVVRGNLILNGGTLNSASSYAVENWFRATIKDGTVNGAVSSWTYSGGVDSTLEITGGTVNGDVTSVNYGDANKVAKVAITGGTVTGKLDTRSYDPATGKLTSIADAAKATIEVTGGTFSSDPTKYVVEDSAVTKNEDNTYSVAKAYLAKVGETSYYTMEEAISAQTASGEAIDLLRDYTTGSTFSSGTVARVVNLNGHTWTYTGTDANRAAFEINYPNASLAVKNGKIDSSQLVGLIPSASAGVSGGTTTYYDNSSLTFENVVMSTTATSGIETNGNNTNDSVTLKDSTLNVPNGFGIYFPSSGKLTIENSTINAKTMGVQVCAGSLSINAGSAITVTGGPVDKAENDGAIQDGAAISIVNRSGYKGLGNITVTGGKFTAKEGNSAIKAYNWANKIESDFDNSTNIIAISGGTFSSIPGNMNDLCADGHIPVKNADVYAVQMGTYVASIGTKKFASLAEAIAAAQSGDTVTLLHNVDLTETLIIKDKAITLNLNGKTISNSTDIWNESIYAWSLISVRDNGNLTIDDTAGGGTLKAKENDCFALDVYAHDIKNAENTKLTINAGNYVSNVSAVYAFTGKVTINGGHFSIQQLSSSNDYRFMLNCYDDSYKAGRAGFTVNGGTFEHYDPRNNAAEGANTSFVAEGVGVDADSTNGTFTAKPNMAAQIVDENGGSVKAYAGHYDAIAAAKNGETVILLSDRKNFVTNTIEANITIDLNGKTLSLGNNNPFFRTNGEVTIQNGTITSNMACAIVNAYNKLTLKNVTITGVTGDKGMNLVNVCSNAEVTIDKDTVLTASGSNGAAVFIGQDADAKYTLNVYGKVIRESKSFAISGNGSYKGTTTINIYDGAEVKSASVAIYHPQAGVINVYGGLVEGYCAIGIKSGTLNINGGTVRGTADDHLLDDSNSTSGTIIYDGSAIVVDSRAAGYAGNVNINVTGGTVESCYSTAIREIGEQDKPDMTQLTKLNVTGGNVFGASSNIGNVTNDMLVRDISVKNVSVSGGTFNHEVQSEYCAIGYEPKDNKNGTYTVAVAGNVEATYTDATGVEKAGTLAEALSNAKAGTTITLLKNVENGGFALMDNKCIDLNGHTLDASYVFMANNTTGGIFDSKDGLGILKVGVKNQTLLSVNSQMPVYDETDGGYRFYTAAVVSNKANANDPGKVKLTFYVLFKNHDAYGKISGNVNQLNVKLELLVSSSDGIVRTQEFAFAAELVKTWADAYSKDAGANQVFAVTLVGMDAFAGRTFTGTPMAISAFTGQILSGAKINYTVPQNGTN